MTSALVGSAKVEVIGDLGKFARDTDTKIKETMSKMGLVVDEQATQIETKMGGQGEKAGNAYSQALARAAHTSLVQVAEQDASRATSADAEFTRVGERLGTTFAHAIIGGIDTGGGGLTRAVDSEVTRAGESARVRMGEQGRLAGEKFGESAKEGMHGLTSTIVGGIGALGIGEVLKGSVEAADQLEAANIKVEGSFGKSAEEVQAWAKTMANSYGLSQSAAEGVAGTFGQMFHGMGVGQEEAAGMAEKLTTLTENVAKFNNADPATVQAAFQAAMRGRGKALLQLGINLDSTTLAAQALSHHIVSTSVDQSKLTAAQDAYSQAVAAQQATDKKTTSTALDRKVALDKVNAAHAALGAVMAGNMPTLTQSQKGEAAYYAILAGTRNQENAVADSSHTLAQQKKMLQAQVQNLESSFGNLLLPILTKVATFMTGDVVPALKDVGHWIGQNKDWLVPLAIALGTALAAYKAVTIVQGVYASVTKGIAAVMGLFTAAQTEATVATEGTAVATTELDAAMDANPIGLVVAAIAALAVGLMYAWNHSKTFRDVIIDTWHAIKTVVLAVWNDVLHPVLKLWVDQWKLAWGFIQGAWRDVGKPVFDFIGQHWGLILAGLTGGISLLVQHWRDLWHVLRVVWDSTGKPVLDVILAIWRETFHLIGVAISGFEALWMGTWRTLTGAVRFVRDNIVDPIVNLFGGIGNTLITIFQGTTAIVMSILKGIADAAIGVVNMGIGGINSLIHAFNDTTGGLSDIWSWTGIPSIPNVPDIPPIPYLARGGDLRPGLNIVGEEGAEAIWNSGGRTTVLPAPSTKNLPDNGIQQKGVMSDEELAAIMALASRPQQLVLPDKRVLAQAVNEGNLMNGRRQ